LDVDARWRPDRPWSWAELRGDVRLTEREQEAGRVGLCLTRGDLKADVVDLRVGTFEAEGHAEGRCDAHGLQVLRAEGRVGVLAEQVADVLHAWGIGETEGGGDSEPKHRVPFAMGGKAEARARLSWDRRRGLELKGQTLVRDPRWHGAQADALETQVYIRDRQLFLEDVSLRRGESGRAWGELWLRFDPRADGEDFAMCFQGERLPIEVGLKAADLDLPVTGLGSGWVRLHGPYDRLKLEAEGQAESARVYGVAIPALRATLAYDLAEERIRIPELRCSESVEGLGRGEVPPSGLLALTGALELDLARQRWQGRLTGNVDSDRLGLGWARFQGWLDARLDGPWAQPFGPWTCPLGQLSLRGGRVFFGRQSLEGLEAQLRFESHAGSLALSMAGKTDPLLRLDLWPDGETLRGTLDLTLDAERADTAHLAGRLTDDLLRDVRLALRSQGTVDGGGWHWEGRLERLEALFDGFDLNQTLPTRIRREGDRVHVDMQLEGRAYVGKAEGAETAFLRASGELPLDGTAPLGVRLEGRAELANLKRILDHLLEVDPYGLLGELQPQGTATFDVTLGGAWEHPTLDGHLDLREGRLQVRTYPQSVEDLAFRLGFRGRELWLDPGAPLQGSLAQGRLKAWGRATWGFGGLSAYDLEARLQGFELRDLPEGFELRGDLIASLRGDAQQGLLKGTLTADRMRYQADLNLRELILDNALGGTGLGTSLDPEDPLGRIALDLDLVLKQPWEFDTNLLKLQGRPTGTFKVAGTLLHPGLKGRMELVPGGRLTNLLPAGDVVLERGAIDFQDPRRLNPFLDLQGRVDVPPYLVDLEIRGTLDTLDMRPSSTPSLRRDEITAILIDPTLAASVGSGMGSGSMQSAATSGLARMGGGLLSSLVLADFQERVRKAFNLDRVNVAWRTGSAGSYETTVTLGKTLNLGERRVPLVFTHRKNADVVTLSGQVEWRIGNFVLQLGASQSGSTGLNPSGEIRHSWSPR